MKIKDCKFGPMMYLDNDKFIGGAIEAYGEHHVPELELLFEVVKEGDYVIDVGTNIGTIAIPLAQKVGKDGFLFGYEAQDMLYYTLCGNIALNGLRNVKPFNQAVGASSGILYVPEFSYEEKDWNYGGVSMNKYSGNPVRVTTLDSLVQLDVANKLKLIKIDVEGMEVDVLRGAEQLIARARPYLAIEAMDHHEVLCDILKEYNYKVHVWEPPYFNPDNFAGNGENILGRHVVMLNIFCWPAEEELEVDSQYFIKDLAGSENPRHRAWDQMIAKFGLEPNGSLEDTSSEAISETA